MSDEQPGMPDMGSLLGMAMEMQQQMLAASQQAAETVLEGQSGGGVVKVEVTGGFEFRSVTIAREVVDPDDVEMLQDLVLAALHDAVARVNELNVAANPLSGLAMGTAPALDDLAGMDFGAVAGLLGGAGGDAGPLPVIDVPGEDDEDPGDGPGGPGTGSTAG